MRIHTETPKMKWEPKNEPNTLQECIEQWNRRSARSKELIDQHLKAGDRELAAACRGQQDAYDRCVKQLIKIAFRKVEPLGF
jgi:hypothetical protein